MANCTFSTDAEWRSIPDFPGYEISSHGEVRSLAREYVRHGHPVKVRERLLKSRVKRRDGKPVAVLVSLSRDGKGHHLRIHRLVLEAFVGPCPDGMEGCHNDGNPLRNVVDNLRWDTPKENQADSVRHGTKHAPPQHIGEAHPSARMTPEKVRIIRSVNDWSYGAVVRVARQLGVTERMVHSVRTGETWGHVR